MSGQEPSRSRPPPVVWLTGLPSSGKTTLARAVSSRLETLSIPSEVLDGDELRRTESRDLGFSPEDRREQARRAAVKANVLARDGRLPIVALVSPYRAHREEARTIIGGGTWIEVYLRCPREILERRDSAGLYRKARDGKLSGLTGVDAPYEVPEAPALTLDTDREPVEACVEKICACIFASFLPRFGKMGEEPSLPKAGPKEVWDLGGFPGIVLETVPTPEKGKTLTYVAMLPHLKTGQIANPYFLQDFTYNRSERYARVLPRGPADWITLPLSVIESTSRQAGA